MRRGEPSGPPPSSSTAKEEPSHSPPTSSSAREESSHPPPCSGTGREELPQRDIPSTSRPRRDLPDDLWLRILALGALGPVGLRELCSLSMCSRKFRALCATDSVWREMYLQRWQAEGAEGGDHGKQKAAAEGRAEGAETQRQAGVPPGEGSASRQAAATAATGALTQRLARGIASEGFAKQKQAASTSAEGRTRLVSLGPVEGKQRQLAGTAAEAEQKAETPAPGCASWREAFQKRFEKEKMQQLIRHKRKVLRAQSKLEILKRDIAHTMTEQEQAKKRSSALRASLASARQLRSTLAAVRIWQPHTVVRRHEQSLEQHTVTPEAQILAVEQELQDCLVQIRVLTNSLAKRREDLRAAEKEVEFLTFKPT